jgi:hypothetical protein
MCGVAKTAPYTQESCRTRPAREGEKRRVKREKGRKKKREEGRGKREEGREKKGVERGKI